MASNLKLISELASETTREVTRDVDGWKRYLTTAARLYKYEFKEECYSCYSENQVGNLQFSRIIVFLLFNIYSWSGGSGSPN